VEIYIYIIHMYNIIFKGCQIFDTLLRPNIRSHTTTVLTTHRCILTFRHHASYIWDRRAAPPHSPLFIYLVNKYI